MFKAIRVRSSRTATPVRFVTAGKNRSGPRGFSGSAGTVRFHEDVVYVGLGDRESIDDATIRAAGGRLVQELGRLDIRAISFERPDKRIKIKSIERAGRCVAEGMALRNWRVDFFDGSATKNEKPKPALSIHAADKQMLAGLRRGLTTAESTNYARRVAATPPNICNPTWMAKEARSLARRFDSVSCKVIGYSEAKKLGMGGIVNVGMASAHKPCLIQLSYKPPRPSKSARGRHLVLVGKTITYDTGGYSLKISNGMKGMKYDKCGGMAVLGAMDAIASLKLPVAVTALLPTAENMVGGDAYRPDDIITMYNGATVEVTNTDAEGRLVLADALSYACKKLTPTAIVDVATLTGGVVVALGSWSAGLFCEHNELRESIYNAANTSGEMVWRLPLWESHRDFMRSKHADIWNSGPKRDGHPIQGAAFLSYFVDDVIPWAHIDIAGMAAVDSNTDTHCVGPTGFGVRLLVDLVDGYA